VRLPCETQTLTRISKVSVCTRECVYACVSVYVDDMKVSVCTRECVYACVSVYVKSDPHF